MPSESVHRGQKMARTSQGRSIILPGILLGLGLGGFMDEILLHQICSGPTCARATGGAPSR